MARNADVVDVEDVVRRATNGDCLTHEFMVHLSSVRTVELKLWHGAKLGALRTAGKQEISAA
jgi:hypothetical protein